MLGFDFDVTGTETVRQTGQVFLEKLRSDAQADPTEQGATPFPAASDITGLALRYQPGPDISFLEPCAGTGIFFSALLHHVADHNGELTLRSAHAVERDQQFAALAHDLWAPAGLDVHSRDFLELTEADLPRATMVLSRPPATFHHQLSSNAKIRAANAAETSSGIRPTGVADLYSHFVLATHKFLAARAVSAWVLPTKFLHHTSGRALREYLAQQVRLHRIHTYDAGAFDVTRFEEKIDEWSVIVFSNETPQTTDAIEFSLGGELLDPDTTTQIRYSQLDPETNWFQVAASDRTKPATLEDFFFIRNGWEIPAADFFVQPENIARQHGIRPVHLHPLLPAPDQPRGQIIEADQYGYPITPTTHVVITTQKTAEELAIIDPALLHYLSTADDTTRALATRNDTTPWYSLTLRRPAPIVVRLAPVGPAFQFMLNQSDGIAGPGWITLTPNLGFAKSWFLEHDVNWTEILQRLNTIDLPSRPAVFSPNTLAGLDATPIADYLTSFD